jgi:hypothetical protein
MTKFCLMLVLLGTIGGCSLRGEPFTINLGFVCIPCNNAFVTGGCGMMKQCEPKEYSGSLEPDEEGHD